jgi:hypothetical protein
VSVLISLMAASVVDLSEWVLGKVAFANLSGIFHKRVIYALIRRLINDSQLIVTLKTNITNFAFSTTTLAVHEESRSVVVNLLLYSQLYEPEQRWLNLAARTNNSR